MPAAFAALFLIALFTASFAGAVPLIVFAIYGVTSIVAFIAYGIDKSAARRQLRRTRESTLHALGLAGGWPGALIAQSLFRHKTHKQAFQAIFWTTAILNCAGFAVFLLSGWESPRA